MILLLFLIIIIIIIIIDLIKKEMDGRKMVVMDAGMNMVEGKTIWGGGE